MISARFNRICIVMMSAVGDAVHVLPLVTALKRAHPDSHITWVLQPGPAGLIRGHPDVDEILVFRKDDGWRAYRDVRRQMRRYDLLLALQVYFKAGLLTALAPADVKLGFDFDRSRDLNWLFTTHRIPPHAWQHVQDQYLEFLTALGVPAEPLIWNIGPWDSERATQRAFFDTLDRPAAALGISSSERAREWPLDRWRAICEALYRDYGLQPVLVGGATSREREQEAAIMSECSVPVISTLGIPLRDLVGILEGSALAIAVNSAPMHIAVAVNRPVISLLGHRNPKRTGPYRFADLRVDRYGANGEDYPFSFEQRPGTMENIQVSDVRAALDVWRSNYGPDWGR